MQSTGTNLPQDLTEDLTSDLTSDLTEDLTWIGDVPVLDEPHAWLLRRLSWERRLAELERGGA